MPARAEVYGPAGQVWLSFGHRTSRMMGILTYGSPTAMLTYDFTIKSGERPFHYWQGSNGLFMAYMARTNIGGNVWRLQFQVNRMAGSSGGAIRIYFGVG